MRKIKRVKTEKSQSIKIIHGQRIEMNKLELKRVKELKRELYDSPS